MLSEFGRVWLRGAPAQHDEWGFIWPDLWEHFQRDSELERLGREWLVSAPKMHGAWGYIWPSLWSSYPGDEELFEVAYGWLGAVVSSNHRGWPHVWKELWAESTGDEALMTLARRWLEVTRPYRTWQEVWIQIIKHGELEDGLDILNSTECINHAFWASTWRSVKEVTGGDERTLRQLRKWLESTEFSHGAWPYVWRVLWSVKADWDLETRGFQWLDEIPGGERTWGLLWIAFWEGTSEESRHRLRNIGQSWLSQGGKKHADRPFVIQCLEESHE
jgi:hypothetical protein